MRYAADAEDVARAEPEPNDIWQQSIAPSELREIPTREAPPLQVEAIIACSPRPDHWERIRKLATQSIKSTILRAAGIHESRLVVWSDGASVIHDHRIT